MDLAGYLARKFGGADRLHQVHDRLDHAAADVDIDFRWDGKRAGQHLRRPPADRLGARRRRAPAPSTRCTSGCSGPTSPTTSTSPTTACWPGWPARSGSTPTRPPRCWPPAATPTTVRAEELRAAELDIHAVPTFVIEGRWAIPGAQDVDTFAELLERSPRAPRPADGGRAARRRPPRAVRRRLLRCVTTPPVGVTGGEAMGSIDPSLRQWFRIRNRLPRPRSHGTDCLGPAATRACS